MQIPQVSPAEARRLQGEGAALLDVREPEEWAQGHAPGAVLVPLGQLALDNVPAARPVVVVCHVGGRSAQATAALLSAGIEAVNVAGGMDEWAAAGLPVVRD